MDRGLERASRPRTTTDGARACDRWGPRMGPPSEPGPNSLRHRLRPLGRGHSGLGRCGMPRNRSRIHREKEPPVPALQLGNGDPRARQPDGGDRPCPPVSTRRASRADVSAVRIADTVEVTPHSMALVVDGDRVWSRTVHHLPHAGCRRLADRRRSDAPREPTLDAAPSGRFHARDDLHERPG